MADNDCIDLRLHSNFISLGQKLCSVLEPIALVATPQRIRGTTVNMVTSGLSAPRTWLLFHTQEEKEESEDES
jgi:hypothetical protein